MDVGLRAISPKHNIKLSVVDLTEGMKEINKLQNTNPLAGVALARVTTANALLGMELKNGETTSSTIATKDGLAKKIVTEFQGDGFRSYIQNGIFDPKKINPDKEPIMQVIGHEGTLIVTQSTKSGQPYVSQIEMQDKNIDYNYMEFLRQSNQIDSVIVTATRLNDNLELEKAVGMLIQLFPEHTEEDIEFISKKLGNNEYLGNILLKSTNYTSLVEEIVEDAIVLNSKELKFTKSCSYEKSLNAVRMLNKKEIEEMAESGENAEVICDFCKTRYTISNDDLKELANEKKS